MLILIDKTKYSRGGSECGSSQNQTLLLCTFEDPVGINKIHVTTKQQTHWGEASSLVLHHIGIRFRIITRKMLEDTKFWSSFQVVPLAIGMFELVPNGYKFERSPVWMFHV